MPLFYNHNLLIDRKPIFLKQWYDKGIRYVKDVMNINCKFTDRIELERLTGLKINFLIHAGIKRNITQLLNKLHLTEITTTECFFSDNTFLFKTNH